MRTQPKVRPSGNVTDADRKIFEDMLHCLAMQEFDLTASVEEQVHSKATQCAQSGPIS